MSNERGDLRVNMDGNMSGFKAMLSGAKRETDKFVEDVGKSWSLGSLGKGFLGGMAGALSFQGIKGFVEAIFQHTREIKDFAEQFDLSTDSVQRWEKAMGKAGMGAERFFRALESLRARREEARSDPTKGGIFKMLGLGSAALDEGVSDEQLLLQLLGSGASRPVLNSLLGRGGSRLGAAVPYLAGSEPAQSAESIEQLDRSWRKVEGVWHNVLNLGARILGGWAGMGEIFTKGYTEVLAEMTAEAVLKNKHEGEIDPDKMPTHIPQTAEHELKVQKEFADEQVRQFEQAQKMHELQRKMVSTGEARLQIEKDMRAIQDEVTRLDDNPELSSELREALRPKRDQLIQQWQSLAAELMQKPVNFNADSLAAIGGFTAASASHNPILKLQDDQLNVMRSMDRKLDDIRRNGSAANNPWQ